MAMVLVVNGKYLVEGMKAVSALSTFYLSPKWPATSVSFGAVALYGSSLQCLSAATSCQEDVTTPV